MKYDRPVWKIMHQCADSMPETFRYEDVRDWFFTYYPKVNEATIRAHLIGLTEGGRAKHVQFAHRSAVFRRVTRGVYAAVPASERGEDPNDPQTSSRVKVGGFRARQVPDHGPSSTHQGALGKVCEPVEADADSVTPPATSLLAQAARREPFVFDVILLGSLSDRVCVPAPAREIFRGLEFHLSRADAERSGSDWFILSAEHGLVAPHEWISPDPRTLADLEADYRSVWALWVVTRLESLMGPLAGMTIRVDAPDVFIAPIFAELSAHGAIVASGNLEPPVARKPPSRVPSGDLADVLPIRTDVSRFLSDASRAAPASVLETFAGAPGVYAWLVDADGARTLSRCLRLSVHEGVLFIGQATHLRAVDRTSTFRSTLATLLRAYLDLQSSSDPQLTAWMYKHLNVTVWPGDGMRDLHTVEQEVMTELNPPLNLDLPPTAGHSERIEQMREGLA